MGWFSKKKKENVSKDSKQVDTINVEELKSSAENLKEELKTCTDSERVDILNQIGDIYYKIADYNEAEIYYEDSLKEEKTIGKTYTNLLNIYNIKRKEAAINKDDAKIQYYLGKIDEMMKISKDVVRGNI